MAKPPKPAAGPTRRLDRKIWTAKVLAGVPYANLAMELERLEDGTAVATIKLAKPGYMKPPLSWVLPLSKYRRVLLDRPGMEVLDACDGQRTVEQIVEDFAAKHRLSFREAQLAVMQFLRQLIDRGIVAVVGLEKEPRER